MDEQTSTDTGIIKELGNLPPDTVVSEEALAKMFDRHRVSIKRAVERGELPPSVRLFGEPVWTVRALREHLSKRLETAKQEAEKLQQGISRFST